MHKDFLLVLAAMAVTAGAYGQTPEDTPADTAADKTLTRELHEVVVSQQRPGVTRMNDAQGGIVINKVELFKAACCNLGESFSTNPSVDVNYDDAATGAKQIRLLGLNGTYIQMLTENLPNFRGMAAPYSLGYLPGPWMKSIHVSKGAATVRNGYESITGQIDVEYVKPEDDPGATINLYGNSDGRIEANADANLHITPKLNTEILAHYEQSLMENMDRNDDGFIDKPDVRQVNVQNRWSWLGQRYVFHGGVGLIDEDRKSGQVRNAASTPTFDIGLKTRRYEGYMKHAFIIDTTHATNLAFMGIASLHQLDANYGHKSFDADQKNIYAQILFETSPAEAHNLSVGVGVNHDHLDQHINRENTDDTPPEHIIEKETTAGVYAQYTFTPNDALTLMAGLRADHSSLHGMFVTPRFHARYKFSNKFNLRLSVGKGYRSAHALADNNYLLASGRTLVVNPLNQENAWNTGVSASFTLPLAWRTLRVNVEYYYTRFGNQAVVDYDSDPMKIIIADLDGKSYSHTLQVDASCALAPRLEAQVAYRLNDVRTTVGGELREKPLTNKFKGLFTLSYKTEMDIWQFDATLQVNGGGRMPTPYTLDDGTPSWSRRFPAFCQLSAQVTRWFRHFSVYVGGENITNYRQKNPIIAADQPWSDRFEPTMVWGPVGGAMVYAGVRINLGKRL